MNYLYLVVSFNDLGIFFTSLLFQYNDLVDDLELEGKTDVPMVLDDNSNPLEEDQDKLKEL